MLMHFYIHITCLFIIQFLCANVAIRFMGRIIILQSAVIVVAAAITVATYTLNNIH